MRRSAHQGLLKVRKKSWLSHFNFPSTWTCSGSYGTLELGLAFDEPNELLVVSVIKARKIKGMDANGFSDAYCKVNLLVPPSAPVLGCSQQCTKTVHRSVNPAFNSMIHFTGVSAAAVDAGNISFAILGESENMFAIMIKTRISLAY